MVWYTLVCTEEMYEPDTSGDIPQMRGNVEKVCTVNVRMYPLPGDKTRSQALAT